MTAPISPPPQQSYLSNVDESRLPRGQCRYILLNPEIKGQRCACIGFTLNHDHPGVVCQCGHQSCYHVRDVDPQPGTDEVDRLRQRVRALEQQLDREYQGGLGGDLAAIVKRLGELEDVVEKSKEETAADIKGCYRNVSRTWQSVDQVIRRQKLQDTFWDERLDDHADSLSRLDDKFKELNEVSISIEERLESLERSDAETEDPIQAAMSALTQHELNDRTPLGPVRSTLRDLETIQGHEAERKLVTSDSNTPSAPKDSAVESQEWTVHISLLPSMSQPFPFEKDTRAYKRCLSRGLHRMVAVSGYDSDSFVSAVSESFGQLLKGRDWAPLHARLCDTQPLAGLPMLRHLDSALTKPSNYTHEFLSEHCAVLSPDGKIDSLYIAMLHDTVSWEELRASPTFLNGLASSWDFDPRLDRREPGSGGPSVTADAASCFPHHTAKKRQSTEISQGSETRCRSSSPTMTRTTQPSAAARTETTTNQAVAGMADISESDAYLRPFKVPRTTYDLPVTIKVQPRGETTALA